MSTLVKHSLDKRCHSNEHWLTGIDTCNSDNVQSFGDSFWGYPTDRIVSPSPLMTASISTLSKVASTTTIAPLTSATTPSNTLESQWVQRIEDALEQDLFFLYYQVTHPVDEKAETVREVLIRLPDEKTGKILLPRVFLPTAERCNLMPDIDLWVVRRCFKEIASTALSNTIYSINLSQQTLHHNEFISAIERALKEFSVEPSHICFEMTETDVLLDLQSTTKALLHLKDLGFRFALDNFGWRISAHGYLRQLPVDYIKLDGSLIPDMMASDQSTGVMLALLNQLRQEMSIATVASHVSSSAIAEAATKLNFDYLQGFILGEPRPFVLL